jgi:tetratricopeptide (TPR) repeat protein
MAKSRRVTKSRTSARKSPRPAPKRAATARRRPAKKASRPVQRQPIAKKASKAPKSTKAPAVAAAGKPVPAAPPPPPPQPPPRKPTYHEAVAMYERGLQALQRRDFAASAAALRNVIERYPDERELLERARLYLKVCERELEPKEPTPKTADEWVYAATVAQNSGDLASSLRHLQRALTEDPRHDHAHYMMAVASAQRRDAGTALEHLRRAISLNPENRSRARQDADLESLRDDPSFRAALEAPAAVPAEPRPAAAVASAARARKARR